MNISVNGQRKTILIAKLTMALEELGYKHMKLATALNGEFISIRDRACLIIFIAFLALTMGTSNFSLADGVIAIIDIPLNSERVKVGAGVFSPIINHAFFSFRGAVIAGQTLSRES